MHLAGGFDRAVRALGVTSVVKVIATRNVTFVKTNALPEPAIRQTLAEEAVTTLACKHTRTGKAWPYPELV